MMKFSMLMLVFGLFECPVWALDLAAHHGDLQVKTASGKSSTWSVEKLNAQLGTSVLEAQDRYDGHKKKRFVGYKLKDLVSLLEIPKDWPAEDTEISFQCADGYQPTLPLSWLSEGEALLAHGIEGKSEWDPITQGKAQLSPGPFYLVWNKSEERLPSPYQVVAITAVSFREKFAAIFPKDYNGRGTAARGLQVFKEHCLRCHSINLVGGDLGPELNIPQNITEYRDMNQLMKFIRDPSSFRARSKMPSFDFLPKGAIDDVMVYLRKMRDSKRKT
jgi:cytochrome c2